MKKSLLLLVLATILASCKPFDQETVSRQNRSEIDLSNLKAKTLKNAVISGGEIQRIDSFPSQYVSSRPVDIWLPNKYSKDKTYSVLYMHDGQNLFDATNTENKQEWMVDEIATKLMDDGDVREFIVVGIHSIPKTRWKDLFRKKL
ncbi:alpha/beta hydrolase-fold protein [Lacinutrix neustonica]|uniref:Alpha/beta hydrolase-fold protein n=1 Tax=Lacinutrix neustonica TaxID=2980107 RepID=A0A9E8MTX3_9FLAO|nr:alpha/beta hydrolase-fold protein [Lacinutrix neustonica]WAC01373.1 alpha/beta hydrolase-fold protein [Lacinutrix neustonica]